ncbi:MAG: lipid-A-disaccharide synthase, partial [Ignavibacteria bacterium]
EMKLQKQNINFSGIGGPECKKENVELLFEVKDVSYFGFSSVVRNLRKIKSILEACKDHIKRTSPSAVILVDYPGFNLKLVTIIRKFYHGKIIYFISPQLWAWHKNRIKIIKKYIDLMIVVFPFEVDFYEKENIRAEFAGHPLVKRMENFLSENQKVNSNKIQISISPGSRKDEVGRMLPILAEAGTKFKNEFECEINILCSPNFDKSYYQNFIEGKDFNLIYDTDNSNLNYKTILNSELVITKSGTSTIECALIGTPFCVVYKTGNINYFIAKSLVKLKYIAMVNILLNKPAVKEFIQNEMTVTNIFNEGKKILLDKQYRIQMENCFKELKIILTSKDASLNAARVITNLLYKN